MACVIDWGHQFAMLCGILLSAKIPDTNAFWPMVLGDGSWWTPFKLAH